MFCLSNWSEWGQEDNEIVRILPQCFQPCRVSSDGIMGHLQSIMKDPQYPWLIR